ncbi:MAG: PAC2 family protein, partial [Nitrososphaerales archaeon]
MKLKQIESVKVNDIVLVAALPDMGRVGGLVSGFLAKQLDTKLVAEIESIEKPWVTYENGIANLHVDTYKIFADKKNSIIIFTGDTQPQDTHELYGLCDLLLDTVQGYGNVKRLYSSGGYLKQEVVGEPKVYGTASNASLLKDLDKYNIGRLGNEVNTITWFNGLILGMAAKRGIDSIGLFGEIDNPSVPQHLAAKSIVKVIARMINAEINTKDLEQQHENVAVGEMSKDDSGFT